MEGQDGLDITGDSGGAAAEFSDEPPSLEGGHGLAAERAGLGMGDIDGSLACGELVPAASVGEADGAAGPLGVPCPPSSGCRLGPGRGML